MHHPKDANGTDGMKRNEIQQLLAGGEWNDVEFKEARRAVPKSAYDTVAAFANTHGGVLVFGIAETTDEYIVVGVDCPDKIQNDFLSVLHAGAKVNHDIDVTEQRHTIDGKTVLEYSKPQLDEKDASARKLIEARKGDKMLYGGSISLQAESHPCEFRKVELKVLHD